MKEQEPNFDDEMRQDEVVLVYQRILNEKPSEALKENALNNYRHVVQSKTSRQPWFKQLWQHLRSSYDARKTKDSPYVRRLQIGLSLAICIALLIMIVPAPSGVNQQVSEMYALSGIQNAESNAAILRGLPLPWENAALGFDPSPVDISTQAYGAGLWMGRVELLGSEKKSTPAIFSPGEDIDWRDSNWADYYAFGRWTVLVWTVVQSQPIQTDWSMHQRLLNRLLLNFSERLPEDKTAQLVVSELQRIQKLLTKAKQPVDSGALEKLSHELVVTMHKFGPTNL